MGQKTVILELDVGNSRIKWRRMSVDRCETLSRGINPMKINSLLSKSTMVRLHVFLWAVSQIND